MWGLLELNYQDFDVMNKAEMISRQLSLRRDVS